MRGSAWGETGTLDVSRQGRIFSPDLWPGDMTSCASWHFSFPDPSKGRRESGHKVCMRHNSFNGSWILIVDGCISAKGYEPIGVRTFKVSFTLDSQDFDVLFDGTSGIFFSHTLINRSSSHIGKINDFQTALNYRLCETRLPKMAHIDSIRISGSNIALYQIHVELDDGNQLLSERRYTEFYIFDKVIRSQTSPHLISSLPALPGKVYNPWCNQLDPTFLQSRKTALSEYLRFMLGHEKILYYTETLCFLGLEPICGDTLPDEE